MKALLLQLEFPTWKTARPWTYGGGFAIADGLAANGVTCVTVPIGPDGSALSPSSWLSHARRILAGQRFDQVWIWLVHAALDPSLLEWVAELAPVRIGFFMESLRYEEEDYTWAPELRTRHAAFHRQLDYLTHAVLVDERDVAELTQLGKTPALWFPGLVPRRFIASPTRRPSRNQAVFHGNVYGERAHWIEHPQLRDRMVFAQSPLQYTPNQKRFDELQSVAHERLLHRPLVTAGDLEGYVRALHTVREAEFRDWLSGLSEWAAIVNLPGLTRCFGGRVYEAMAACRPVISWRIPGRPRMNALFEDNRDILLFSPDDPGSLAHHIDRILRDTPFAQAVGIQGQRTLLAYHTAERRMKDVLQWLESGVTPDYGTQPTIAEQPTGLGAATSITGQTEPSPPSNPAVSVTVFILTVGDPAFPACKASIEQQTGIAFALELIRDVAPFSAAAQDMIARCTTPYFVQVDEDMTLNPDAVRAMVQRMVQAPADVGMICFHLYDDDRECPIQGVKIYRTDLMKRVRFNDLKASEMNLLDQMGEQGIRWILHPDVIGHHGTLYTPDTIYRRYKTMYEKDIRQWNLLTSDIQRKARKYRETGDHVQLFALLGAAHGIIEAPRAPDREKDARLYNLKELDVFKRVFNAQAQTSQRYDPMRESTPLRNPPIPVDQVQWGNADPRPSAGPSRTNAAIDPLASGPQNAPACPRRILIVTPYFWPSVGGVETVAEDLGAGLAAAGLAVDIACYRHEERRALRHRGVGIIEVATADCLTNDLPTAVIHVKELVASGKYDACILLGAPTNAMFYGILDIPDLNVRRIIYQPTVNAEVYEFLKTNAHVRFLVKQLARQATAVITLGHDTFDARLCREERLPVTIIPNGTPSLLPSSDFRQRYRIPKEQFLIVHVANFYRVKNHPGLLEALSGLPPQATLLMIGHPTHEADYVAEVQQLLASHPHVRFIPGLTRLEVASAIHAADLVVLSSTAEVSPLCLLEAMSLQRPWLATPGCGTASEHAGGLVLPLSEFRAAIECLIHHPDVLAQLAQAGYEHWKTCYRWESILGGWVELLREGRLAQSFDTPESIARLRDDLRSQFQSLRKTPAMPGRQPMRQPPTPSLAPDRARLPARTHASDPTPVTSPQEGAMDQDQFYINMFVKSPGWSAAQPNEDEAARWSKIAGFLEHILRRARVQNPDATLRILEVGSGRGWLSQLASHYGTIEGIEPVAGVVAHARKLFPHIRFETGTADAVLRRPDFSPYDVVLCSEVIEHVPDPEKPAFLDELKRLLTSEGYLILTTPRGEMREQWQKIAPPCQPIEDWITEEHLERQMTAQGFTPLGLERIYVEIPTLRFIPAPTPHNLKTMNLLPIYQVWVAQRTAASPAERRTPMNKTPKVSVIIPTYNRPDRLREAIASVLNQDYQDFHIVVVNDGTIPVEDVVADLNRDGRITLVSHDRNRGLAASRNSGLKQASGTYVCYLDDDDRFLPHHLRTLVAHLEETGSKVAYTDAWRVHERMEGKKLIEFHRDRPYSNEFNPHQLLIANYIPVLCVMHERAVLDEVGAFDETLFAHEDWDLWIRIATRYPFSHIAETTAEFTWRTDGSSMSSQPKDVFFRTMEIIYRKYAPYAAKYAGVRENQQQNLANLRKERPHKQFVCSIIIPVWNKVELTRQCLVALGPATEDVSFELIVVDNHSTDGTPEFLASLGGDVRIITNDENLGFAKACNQGAATATGEYLVFLNNDTIPLKGWCRALVDEVHSNPDVVVVGSKLLYDNDTVQHAGVAIDRLNMTPYHIYAGFASDHPAVNKRRDLNAVTGACLLIRRSVFSELGGFDEGFINGFEDVDLCLKVRDKQGLVIYQPNSVLYHLESQTPGRKQHDLANARRLNQRWGHCWWLVDDDSIYAGDGYKSSHVDQNGKTTFNLYLLDSDAERRGWELVAAMQHAAHRQDLATVETLLRRHDEWPADPSLLSWAASVATAVALPKIAEQFLHRTRVINDPAAQELEHIRAALSDGQLSSAASRVETLLKQFPTHAEALLLKAILHMQREQYREAEIAFTTALNQGANRKKCLMGIGMASMGRAYPQGAWQTFLRVLAENPDDPEVIHWLLRAGTAQNRWNEMSVQLRNFLARNPSDLSVRFAYAGVLLRADQVEVARHEYDQLRALAPSYDGLAELGQAIAGKETLLTMDVSNA
ncbi:MAG: glycosyltransferase [Nitrospira sp.]